MGMGNGHALLDMGKLWDGHGQKLTVPNVSRLLVLLQVP